MFRCRTGAVMVERRREAGAEPLPLPNTVRALGPSESLSLGRSYTQFHMQEMLSSKCSRLRQGLYLDLYSVLCRNGIAQVRQKSTLSAINRGLRDEKPRGRDRSVRGRPSRRLEYEKASRRSDDGKPAKSYEKPTRPTSFGDGRTLRFSSVNPRENRVSTRARPGQYEERSFARRRNSASYKSGERPRRGEFDREGEEQPYARRKDFASYRSGERSGRGDSDGTSTRRRDYDSRGDGYPSFGQARPPNKIKDSDPSGPRILKHTSGDRVMFEEVDIDAEVASVLKSTLAIKTTDSKGTRPSLDQVRQVRRKLQAINAAIQEATGGKSSPAQAIRRQLRDAGLYARQDEIEDLEAEQTVVMETSEKGRFALLLKGQKAKAVTRPDPASQEVRDKDESHFRKDRRADTRDADEARSKPKRISKHDDSDDGIPPAIPRTTAASEFLYGFNVVVAALRAQRRKLYVLHTLSTLSRGQAKSDNYVPALAKAAGVSIQISSREVLDRMSGNRPHNGVVLEASRLPVPPVLKVGKPEFETHATPLLLDRQSAEDAMVNGKPVNIPGPRNTSRTGDSPRQPFIVFLDGIVDEGNLGNILRTAHFYGVDAVAVATSTCAPLSSAIMAKASAGACEAVQLLAVPKPSQFIFDSAKAGWKVYAAVAPDDKSETKPGAKKMSSSRLGMEGPLGRQPCILMLGAEGEGLRANLINKADYLVSIGRSKTGGRASDVGVDSLNVSVAAGVLMDAFTRKAYSSSAAKADEENGKREESDLGF